MDNKLDGIIKKCIDKMQLATNEEIEKMRYVYEKHLKEDYNNYFTFAMEYDKKNYYTKPYCIPKEEYSTTISETKNIGLPTRNTNVWIKLAS
jgi:hypothetical protein